MASSKSKLGIVDIGRYSVHMTQGGSLCTGNGYTINRPLYMERAPISLLEAQIASQRERGARTVPQQVIRDVENCLRRFKTLPICPEARPDTMRIVATEAMRIAENSAEILQRIRAAVGTDVELLSKQQESEMGVKGVAIALQVPLNGLVLDLGGGSVQLNWVTTDRESGRVSYSPTPVSLPYGAVAILSRLEQGESAPALLGEIVSALSNALDTIGVPASLREAKAGLSVYLVGGGFRGFGYYLMAQQNSVPGAYPFASINGFSTPLSRFSQTSSALFEAMHAAVGAESVARVETQYQRYGISKRRAQQAPAVVLVLEAVLHSITGIDVFTFSSGGTREGLLYDYVSPRDRLADPVEAGVLSLLDDASDKRVQRAFTAITKSGIAIQASPEWPHDLEAALPDWVSDGRLLALVAACAAHAPTLAQVPRDTSASRALASVVTGELAGLVGGTHAMLARFALACCEACDGESVDADGVYAQLVHNVLGAQDALWARYVGRIAGLLRLVPLESVREIRASRARWHDPHHHKRCAGPAWSLQVKLALDPVVDNSIVRGYLDRMGVGLKVGGDGEHALARVYVEVAYEFV